MVIVTRSMTRWYNRRIQLISFESVYNRTITSFDAYNIYNDVRYKYYKLGAFEEGDLHALLYSVLFIYYNKLNEYIERANIYSNRYAQQLLLKLHHVDVCMRQFGVNCGFGDLNPNNDVMLPEIGLDKEYYERVYNNDTITSMNLFSSIIGDIDDYTAAVSECIHNCPAMTNIYLDVICPNNFSPDSIYGFLKELS
jgi:hypothetical protein